MRLDFLLVTKVLMIVNYLLTTPRLLATPAKKQKKKIKAIFVANSCKSKLQRKHLSNDTTKT